MRIDSTSISMPNTIQQSTDVQSARSVQTAQAENIVIQENQSETGTEGPVVKEKLEQAIDSINEFFTINNSELKFVLHEGLGKYFAQLVNAETEEVIREIPSKKMLDVFYEMQKLVGMIVDKKI
ncbi:flagellar protein FlaG [Solibacillus kalamii]|nr:flagellar protein FlaG [Solibacillus kalamii]MBM7664869.1 flagellar protein FlaG [Solibacillus kalamii]